MSTSKEQAATGNAEAGADPGRILCDALIAALEEVKAVEPVVIDVHGKTPLTDYLVIASGNSDRHLATLRQAVIEAAREHGQKPLGIEGERGDSEWVLIDLADCVVHLMRPATRAFYDLERLWSLDAPLSSD
ncbi:MAG TPA: ribosome silencing factor [Gammaproteobacteria bacterium]|nr:ribosome silencing factor [Gammaproteobacteria bacterium]